MERFKFIYPLIIVATILTSCMSTGSYKMGLQRVERPQNAKEHYGESKVINFKEKGKFSYRRRYDGNNMDSPSYKIQFYITQQNRAFDENNLGRSNLY